MKTAMNQMLDELMAHEYTIPLELIMKCKELIQVEKEQIEEAYAHGSNDRLKNRMIEYYNEKYGGEK